MPRWSPDAESIAEGIAFFSTRAGRVQLWKIRPDGSELQQVADAASVPRGPLALAFPLGLRLLTTLGLVQRAVEVSFQDWNYNHVWP